MSPEERDRMYELCKQIKEENNPRKFAALIQKLNRLFDSMHDVSENGRSAPPVHSDISSPRKKGPNRYA